MSIKINIGDRFESNRCGWYTIIDFIPHPKGRKYLIEFDEIMSVKYRTVREKKHVISGGVMNPYSPLKLEIACVGNVNSKEYPKEFNKWRGMIERCYDKSNNHYSSYGEIGITVCNRWLCFEYFLNDLSTLQGYEVSKIKNGELDLDKDTKGNRTMYSPENCILISPSENVKEMNKRVKQKSFKAINLEDGSAILSDNQTELSKILNIDQSEISRCLSGNRDYSSGYKFEYTN